ncbi:hypothetical protein KP509_07G009800 [Ceratopteris richardii]|nr:hypothetical protein KP509_07G009800 [Ceratopteris richardii]
MVFRNKGFVPHFSWALCKAKLSLNMDVMPTEHRLAIALLDRISCP